MSVQLTILNAMAAVDFPEALETHRAWGLQTLDLKDHILGKALIDLTEAEAMQAARLIQGRALTVTCLSSAFFQSSVERGEETFRHDYLDRLDHLLMIARILQPAMIRLLAPQTERRAELTDSIAYLQADHPWLIAQYREAIDRIHAAGFHATLENECGRCILSTPAEVCDLFAAIDRPGEVHFTWDVQNMWQVATYPSVEAYQHIRPLIGYYHVKGGQHDGTRTHLRWATALEDASWPVLEITRQVIADGVSPVICLNPSHGGAKPGYDMTEVTRRDIAFLRRELPEIA